MALPLHHSSRMRGQAMVNDLKKLNLGISKELKPIFVSVLLSVDKINEHYQLEMPDLDPSIAVHRLAVKPRT
ncbi:hypothetical protein ACFX19_013153 [Malus domestica]